MLCQQTLFIVTAFLTAVVHSLPSPPIQPYEAEGDHLTLYNGDQTPAKRSFDTVDLNRRQQCDSPGTVTCSGASIYLAVQSDCAGLQSVLSGQQPYNLNGTVTRTEGSVCFLAGGQGSRQCCINLMIPVQNAVDADYLNSVITLNNQCRNGNGVAGIITSTTVKSGCNNVCLSNHGTGRCLDWFESSCDGCR